MIQLQDVAFRYTEGAQWVFRQFNISLQSAGIYGLLGPNGSGKSTLLYLMTGLLHPEEGRAVVDGREAFRRERSLLQDLFIVPEEFELPSMTLADYVDTYRPFYPRFSDEVLSRCLQEFELQPQLHVSQLSMGQRKKVFIAFALACGTRYLLMDEPTNGLDIQSKRQFRRVLASQTDGQRTIVIATHQVHDVEQLLDHVLILGRRGEAEDGSVVLCDAMTSHLTEQLAFSYESEPPAASLYCERNAQGYACIMPRTPGGEETPLNLELLYNAVQSEKLVVNNEKQNN